MAEENNPQEPTTAPVVDKTKLKPVVTPEAVKPETESEEDKDFDEFKVENKDLPVDAEEPESDSAPLAGSTIAPKKDFTAPKKKRNKKPLLVLLFLIILAAGGYIGYTKYYKNDTLTSSPVNSTGTQQSTGPNTFTPVSVAYAFRTSSSIPYKVFTRPAEGGGQHIEANLKLAASEYVTGSDSYGSRLAIATNKAVYSSLDGGKTYKTVTKIDINEAATSLVLSSDGKEIVYANFKTNSENQVKSVLFDGTGSKTLFSSSKGGVELIGYSAVANKIIYMEGCFNCGDSYYSTVLIRDLKTKKVTEAATSSTDSQIISPRISTNFNKLVYGTALRGNSITAAGANYPAAPYTINTVDLKTLKIDEVTAFGTKDETNPNGTSKSRKVLVGFVAGTTTPYYTDDGKLYEIVNDEPTKVYEVATKILYLPFVGKDMIIAGYGNQTSDYFLDSYQVDTKKSANIYSGDDNTIIFGVTTK